MIDLILNYKQTMKLQDIITNLEHEYQSVQSDILKHDVLTSGQQEQLNDINDSLQSLREARREEFRSEIWHEKLKEFLTT